MTTKTVTAFYTDGQRWVLLRLAGTASMTPPGRWSGLPYVGAPNDVITHACYTMTQAEIAAIFGVTQQSVSSWASNLGAGMKLSAQGWQDLALLAAKVLPRG